MNLTYKNHHLLQTKNAIFFQWKQVDIELQEDLPLKKAHTIGETLQIKIKKLPKVKWMFVHLISNVITISE